MALVNPLVLDVAQKVSELGAPDRSRLVFDQPIADQHRELVGGNGIAQLVQWHRNKQRSSANTLADLSVLDLGCGSGYLGKWLAPMGAAYLGVDGSARLLSAAGESRLPAGLAAAKKKICQHVVANLDGGGLDRDNLRYVAASLGSRRLAVGVAILDHLADPGPLLSWLRGVLGAQGVFGLGLFVVLNESYFDRESAPAASVPGSPRRARIDSANVDVTIYQRSFREIASLFRNARLDVLRSGDLRFAKNAAIDEQQIPEVVGRSPFRAFLVRPHPSPQGGVDECGTTLECLLDGRIQSVLSRLPDAQKGDLRRSVADLEITAYAPGARIVSPHSLGGDLYVVIEGGCQLRGRELDISFGVGEILGDLETGPSGRESLFQASISAGVEGATMLWIPAQRVNELLSMEANSLGATFFRQLRDRLNAALWTYNLRDKGKAALSAAGVTTVEFKWMHVDRLSRGLLYASDYERGSSGREPDGGAAFLGSTELLRRARVGHSDASEIAEALRTLVQLQVVDAFPGREIQREAPNLYESAWKQVVDESFERFFPSDSLTPGLRSKMTKLRSNAALTPRTMLLDPKKSPDRDEQALSGRNVGRWTVSAVELWQEAGSIDHSESWTQRVQRWQGFLGCVSSFWFDQSPSYFYIHDSLTLRAIALEDDDNVAELFLARARLLSLKDVGKKIPTWSYIVTGAAPGRLAYYVLRATRFFLRDLAHAEGRLHFSGTIRNYLSPEDGSPVPGTSADRTLANRPSVVPAKPGRPRA